MTAVTILVPTDFSEFSETALEYATSLARDTGAELLIVHVREPPYYYDNAFGGFAVEPNDKAIFKLLEEVKPANSDVRCSHKMLAGDNVTEIVRLAEARNVDMIVMGTHGRGGLSRVLMGSVAENVVRRAPCPVLTIKQPNKVKAEVS
jgi:nucleotide-binding universal stress UspA family protein